MNQFWQCCLEADVLHIYKLHTHTHIDTHIHTDTEISQFFCQSSKRLLSLFCFSFTLRDQKKVPEIPRKTIYISKGTERGIPVPSRKLTSNSKSQCYNVKSPIFNIFRFFFSPQISKQLTQFKQITVLGNNTYHHLYSHASPSEEHKSAFKLL